MALVISARELSCSIYGAISIRMVSRIFRKAEWYLNALIKHEEDKNARALRGKSKGAMPAKKNRILTAGQKTLPKDLQKKIVASKMKKKA